MSGDLADLITLSSFEAELDELESQAAAGIAAVLSAKPEHSLLIGQADWHVRGLLYHVRALLGRYREVVAAIAARTGPRPAMVIMHAPEMQELLFEFYAFMFLARITLDELKNYVRPILSGHNLPNSVNAMLKGATDCPLYRDYLPDNAALLRYLIDMRDCIVHHRSFATSDNTVAVELGFDDASVLLDNSIWHESLIRVTYWFPKEDAVSVNALLPDAVYGYDERGTRIGLIRPFTYDERNNLLIQCREFTKLVSGAVLVALTLLSTHEPSSFAWRRRPAS